MLNTLVHNQLVDKGSQSVLYNPTVVYTHSISFDGDKVSQFAVNFI